MYDDWMEKTPIFGKIRNVYVKPKEEIIGENGNHYKIKIRPEGYSLMPNKYFCIIKEEIEGRKTPIYHIINNKTADEIAVIKWYGAWRKYCLFPNQETIWDNKCLVQIIDFLNKINKKGISNVR